MIAVADGVVYVFTKQICGLIAEHGVFVEYDWISGLAFSKSSRR